MGLDIHKEIFNQGVNFSARPQLLPTGMLHYAENIRPKEGGGWEARMGTRLVNGAPYGATDEDRVAMGDEEVIFGDEEIVYMGSGAESHNTVVDYMKEYTTADIDDDQIIVSVYSHLYSLDDLSSYQSKTYIGNAIATTGLQTAAVVEGRFYHCSGNLRTWSYGGTEEYPIAIMIYDGSEFRYKTWDLDLLFSKKISPYVGYTVDYVAMDSFPTADALYIGTHEPVQTINVDFYSSQVNANAAVLTLSTWTGAAWTSVLDTDGTISGGASFGQDGAITIDIGANTEVSRMINGVHAYWYKLVWDAAFDSHVRIDSITVEAELHTQTTKSDGIYQQAITIYERNTSSGELTDVTGELSNDAKEQFVDIGDSSNHEVWIKTTYPAISFGFAIDPDYPNTVAQPTGGYTIDGYDYSEETLGTNGAELEQSGYYFMPYSITKQKEVKFDDLTEGYWYQLAKDGAPSAEVRLYQVVWTAHPAGIYRAKGITEFRKRLVYWGSPQYPNRLIYSLGGRPDMVVPTNTHISNPIGDDGYIELCVPFKEYLLAFKKNQIILVDADFNSVSISKTVGLLSTKSVQVVEVGDPNMRRDEIVTIAIWLAHDGVYKFDGTSIFKISQSLGKYFDPNSSSYLGTNLSSAAGFFDPTHEEYHLCPSSSYELVFDVRAGAWVATNLRATNIITCSLQPKSFSTDDSQAPVLLGTGFGQVLVLDETATDIDYAGYAHGINIEFYSRFIGAQNQSGMLAEIRLRGLTLEVAPGTGDYTLNIYADGDLTTPIFTSTDSNFNLDAPTANTEIFEFVQDLSFRCRTFLIRISGNDVEGSFEILSVMFRTQGLLEPKR